MKKPRLAIAGTLVMPRGAVRSRIAGEAGSQVFGVVGGIVGSVAGAVGGQLTGAAAERGVRGTSPLETDQVAYLAVMSDSVVLFRVKQGWWSQKLTESVIARTERTETLAARLQRKRLAGILEITFADGSAWAFDIPRGNLGDARRVAAALGSDPRPALARRAMTYEELGRYEEALADLDRLIELDPTGTWAHARRGMAHLELGRHEEALADLDRLIELDPSSRWALARRAMTYEELDRYEEALADLDRLIELDPTGTWAHARRDEAYRRMGRNGEAASDLQQAVERDPGAD
jgi:tetratricopeptide (TPR) repeat protein